MSFVEAVVVIVLAFFKKSQIHNNLVALDGIEPHIRDIVPVLRKDVVPDHGFKLFRRTDIEDENSAFFKTVINV